MCNITAMIEQIISKLTNIEISFVLQEIWMEFFYLESGLDFYLQSTFERRGHMQITIYRLLMT